MVTIVQIIFLHKTHPVVVASLLYVDFFVDLKQSVDPKWNYYSWSD